MVKVKPEGKIIGENVMDENLVAEIKFIISKYEEVVENYIKTSESLKNLALMKGSMYVIRDLKEILKKYDQTG
jgi:hypothetical protein